MDADTSSDTNRGGVVENGNWEHFLEELKDRVGYFQFEVFGRQLSFLEASDNSIKIKVPRDFHREWLQDKQKRACRDALESAFGPNRELHVVVSGESEPSRDTSSGATVRPKNEQNENREFPFASSNDFNPSHTFESFVVGDSNEYAYTAARAISDDPSNSFNPLFIYGGVGLGKTHLLQAIGRRVKKNWEQANVQCINAEQFTNQIINAIREGNTKDFKYRYRNVDMFLVDDVQFLSKTEAAQEEFFHTFNELYEKGKGTVFCSDCPPHEIPKIEERLQSRFGMGLTVDIKPPDYETRIAILQKKAEQDGVEISDDVIHFLADKIESNVRELESSLTRLAMKSSLSSGPITTEMAQQELGDLLDKQQSENTRVVTVDDIQSEVADHFNLSISDLKSKRRTRAIAQPRQIAMYLARERTKQSYSQIGEQFGGRDHSTVIHAENKIEDALDNPDETDLSAHVSALRNEL